MEKEAILEALESGNYEFEFEPVDCVYEYTKYDGTPFYVFEDLDGPKSSTDMGTLTVNVQSEDEWHEFIYDMSCGDWEGDELCNDSDIIEALESIDEFISYDDYDGDKQWEVYANANHIPLNSDYYFGKDDDCPKDIEELGNEDAYIPLKYYLPTSQNTTSEFTNMDCTINDRELYDLYQLIKDKVDASTETNKEDNDEEQDQEEKIIELPDTEIKKTCPGLHETIQEKVEEEAHSHGYDSENGALKFVVSLSKEVFENNL